MFEHCNDRSNPDSHWSIVPLCSYNDCNESEAYYIHRNDNMSSIPARHTFIPYANPVLGETAIRRNACQYAIENTSPDEDNPESYIRCSCPCHWHIYYVNVYSVDRAYGGPEEGGWYYDCGTPVASMPFNTYAEAIAYRQEIAPRFPHGRMWMREESFSIHIESDFAADWPTETPRYS